MAKSLNNASPCIPGKENNLRYVFLFCIFTAFIILTVCTKSSFMYPMNDWVDTNCYFTVGKSMANGKVLYRDIYEQKGPLLYFIYIGIYLFSHDTFLGTFLLEIIGGTFFLFYAYRLLRLYSGQKSAVLFLPLFAALCFSSPAFTHGGSTEELCLPMMMYCMYILFRECKTKQNIRFFEFFLVGVFAGCILWIKFTMLGFFIGWAILPIVSILHEREWRRLLKAALCILGGVAAASIPIFIYFLANHAVKDLFISYIYNNIFVYSTTGNASWLQKLFYVLQAVAKTSIKNIQYAIFTGVGFFFLLIFGNKRERIGYLSILVLLCFFTYIGGRSHIYYGLSLCIFSVFGFACLAQFLERQAWIQLRRFRLVVAALCICSIFLSYFLCGNTYLMKYKRADLPQYQFKEIICQKTSPTLLNYGFLDGGFYTAANLIPTCKYFCTLTIDLPEQAAMQQYFIENGLVDFVITRDEKLPYKNYTLIDSSSLFFEGKDRTYFLYQLITP